MSATEGRMATVPSLPRSPVGVEGGRSTGYWGMVILIFTEATLFAILLTSYFYLRFQGSPVWPPDGIKKPELPLIAPARPSQPLAPTALFEAIVLLRAVSPPPSV